MGATDIGNLLFLFIFIYPSMTCGTPVVHSQSRRITQDWTELAILCTKFVPEVDDGNLSKTGKEVASDNPN
jgi:hypothetical protein